MKTSYKSYIIGYFGSLVFTLSAFYVVWRHIASNHQEFVLHSTLVAILVFLALVQLVWQMIFFLHLGKESKPRWNIMAAIFAGLVVLIVVFGSLWIISNLEYSHDRELTPNEIDSYIIEDEGIRP